MRTVTSAQLADIFGADRQVLYRVRIRDATAHWVEYTVAGGSATDWVNSFSISGNVDQQAVEASVSFFRETDDGTLAPYMASGGSEAIKAGRQIQIDAAIKGIGDSFAESDYWLLFDGFVDDVDWGGIASELTVTGRGEMGLLLDAWTVDENTYGSNAAPVPAETVMQQILDEVFSGTITFDVEGDPDFGIVEYNQRMQSVADALKAIVDLFGWVFRSDWSDVYSDFRFRLYEPDRDRTTADITVEPSDYYDLPTFGESSVDIRNVGVIKWGGGKITAEDSASIAEYGRRKYIVLDATQDTQINTEAKALALITAVVSDLSQPLATQQAVLPLFPPVQINDLYTFTGNNVHYATDQTMAVVGFEHYVGPDGSQTTLDLRGRPTGGVTRWTAMRNRLERDAVPEPDVVDIVSDDIGFYYTTPYGSTGFDLAGTADQSLGGWVSTTEASETLNGIFRAVSETERSTGITLYRSIACINENASPVPQDWECVLGWLGLQGEHGVTWSLALDPQGVYDFTGLFSAKSPDEETAPAASPPLTWVAPESSTASDVLNIGTVPAGSGFIFHIRLEVSSGATGQITDEYVAFQDQVPASV